MLAIKRRQCQSSNGALDGAPTLCTAHGIASAYQTRESCDRATGGANAYRRLATCTKSSACRRRPLTKTFAPPTGSWPGSIIPTNPGDKTAESRFKEIQGAYDVLSDADKRKKYDVYGAAWEHAGQAPPQGRGALMHYRSTYTRPTGTAGGDRD